MPDACGEVMIRCACGGEVTGTWPAALAATQDHGRSIHDLVATEEQIRAMATPAEGGPAEGGPAATSS